MKLSRILTITILSMFISIGAFSSKNEVTVKIDGVTLKTDVPAQV